MGDIFTFWENQKKREEAEKRKAAAAAAVYAAAEKEKQEKAEAEAKKVAEEEKNQAEIDALNRQLNELHKSLDSTSNASDTTTAIRAEAEKIANEISDLGGSVGSTTDDTSMDFTKGSSLANVDSNLAWYNGQSSGAQASAPDSISEGLLNSLLANGAVNNIEIRDSNGNIVDKYKSEAIDLSKGESAKEGDIVVYGGVSYVANRDRNGNLTYDRLLDYNGDDTKVNLNDGTKGEVRQTIRQKQPDGTYKYIILLEEDDSGNHNWSDDSYDDDDDYEEDDNDYNYVSTPTVSTPRPKPKPPVIKYKDVSLYSYQFGIDSVKVSYDTVYNKSVFVSNEIDIGESNEYNYITLNANDYVPEHTSIEYYILDGNKTVPILNNNSSYIEDEQLFQNLPTRFDIKDNSYIIKKNFQDTNILLENIDFSNKNDIYTISYTPVIVPYKPENKIIRVKAILRRYLDDIAAPYINSIQIIKNGGGLIWADTSMT